MEKLRAFTTKLRGTLDVFLILFVCLVVGLVAGLFIGYKWGKNNGLSKASEIAEALLTTVKEEMIVPLIDLSEEETISVNEVQGKLTSISEWATYMGSYHVTSSLEGKRYLGTWAIIGTTHTVEMECDVTIKAGFDVSDVTVDIDNKNQVIYVTLPEITITDQYIVLDTVVCDEDNNIFNMIEYEDYSSMYADIEAQALAQAEEDGIYDAARANAENLIRVALSEFSDYTVEFN